MKTCKDCVHYEACEDYGVDDACKELGVCKQFSDRSEWVHLPCKAGDLLYEITERRTRDKWQKVIKERVVNCIEVGIEGALGIRSWTRYLPLSQLHKTIFLSREEAEKALKDNEDELTREFYIGDEVITATGMVGKINEICYRNLRAGRKLYEATVSVEIGNGKLWIIDYDEDNGFRRFYKIGNRVFGNIDKDRVLEDIKITEKEIAEAQEDIGITKKINRLQKELEQYKAQLNVLNKTIDERGKNDYL